MHRFVRRLTSVLLAATLMVAAVVVPAYAETGSTAPQGSIAAVAAKAKPSVVGILNTMKATRSTESGHSAGTGFVYKPGIIITNAHVVDSAQELKILYADRTVETVAPSQIFADATSDVAVIKVKTPNLVALPFADSDKVTVGMDVIAVGNPLGFRLGNSVSAGILSGVGRALGSGYPFLQVDAPINPGNSGGPLFNLQGEVIGINSAKMSDIGVEGLGFAIPANTAMQIAEKLLKDGKVERATLGISLDEGWEAYFGVPDATGVTVGNVISDGPVGTTGLRSGDKLIKLDNTTIYTSDDVYAFLAGKKPGDVVTITVKRSGQTLSAPVKLVSEDALRKIAEDQGTEGATDEAGGMLRELTAGQIQEAAEFGRQMARGYYSLNDDYFAVSGSNYAVLWTEYLYISRRISSAVEFGFNPGVGFQQSLAKE
ncbi:MAG TPA: trypsin-like peptidase domain-containing protein, partial [Symbiobacteriaceae bacterium]|nr:trypsin-like peptidase domain-containing protein [Symbiobacteriaceae bacterium]